MNTAYWNLFWTTGMPEAWLMSRGGESLGPSGMEPGNGAAGTPAQVRARPQEDISSESGGFF